MFLISLVNCYARKKKTKKTQKVQYNEDDNHPFHSNEIGDSGIRNGN